MSVTSCGGRRPCRSAVTEGGPQGPQAAQTPEEPAGRYLLARLEHPEQCLPVRPQVLQGPARDRLRPQDEPRAVALEEAGPEPLPLPLPLTLTLALLRGEQEA